MYRLILLLIIMLPIDKAVAIQISSIFKEEASSYCPVNTWNITYKACRSELCGKERYDIREVNGKNDGNGGCENDRKNYCEAAKMPGEESEGCTYSCITKSKLSRPFYWESHFFVRLYKVRDKQCEGDQRAAICGEETRTPATYQSCQNWHHEISASKLHELMLSGRGVDRATASLAISISEFKVKLVDEDFNLIDKYLLNISEDSPLEEKRIDALRKYIVASNAMVQKTRIQEIISSLEPELIGNDDQKIVFILNNENEESSLSQRKKYYSSVSKDYSALSNGSAPIYEPTPYVMGYGINSITGLSKGSCIDKTTNVTEIPSGKKVEFELRRIDDYQTLLETLYAKASASVSYGLGSGKGSVEFSKEYKSAENSIFLLANVNVTWDDFIADYKDLDPLWAKIVKSNPRRFYEGCGDIYVKGMRKGNQFLAIYQLFAKDSIEKDRLKASFEGNYAGKFSASADFAQALERAHTYTNVEMRLLSPGFPGGNVPTDADSLTTYVKEFPDKATYDKAVPLIALTGSYSDFPSFKNDNPFVTRQQRSYIQDADRDFEWINAKISLIEHIKDNISEYDFSGLPKDILIKTENNLFVSRENISKLGSECFENSKKCINYKALDQNNFTFPNRKKIVYVTGGCSDKSKRFYNFNGGCRDLETGHIWSAVSDDYWDAEGARQYCSNLKQNNISGWNLPNVFELSSIKASEGGYLGFLKGSNLDDWFWSYDTTIPAQNYRVNTFRGDRKAENDSKLLFKVICRQR
ncbi:MAG: DUF1566 domain-containing protein [Nitrosomonas sp.]|uniref:hypothetical protein n=1 Tax=Nitrosomonas sp. TaxID=42353 RepID=UPI0025EFF5C5|nr:hypothetical protein [Nitrosomonas sp.]MBY0474645.1 DUF1566 domain-containing protein [Nitrosomonas sp.]